MKGEPLSPPPIRFVLAIHSAAMKAFGCLNRPSPSLTPALEGRVREGRDRFCREGRETGPL